jgi:hypothetical protein
MARPSVSAFNSELEHVKKVKAVNNLQNKKLRRLWKRRRVTGYEGNIFCELSYHVSASRVAMTTVCRKIEGSAARFSLLAGQAEAGTHGVTM